MSHIDFVFLAEYAKVEANATVTAVGAGFRGLVVPFDAREITVFLASRLIREAGESETDLVVTTRAPGDLYEVIQTSVLPPIADQNDWATTVVVNAVTVPILDSGEYTIELRLGKGDSRTVPLMIAKGEASDK